MNVASLELCEELYKLSGWMLQDSDLSSDMWDYPHYETEKHGDFIAPKYDLGYLLRKLPSQIGGCFLILKKYDKYGQDWGIMYQGSTKTYPVMDAPTPEDAAAKLAIELFKQGILKKEATR